jgi:aryl-alcohol dehydrogenase-like predicted oxidoreductase
MGDGRIQIRKLGNSGLEIAPLVLGGNVFGWTVDESGTSKLLDRFVDAGFNMVDTSDVYSNWIAGNRGGESETLIGKWLQQSGKRDRILIATKLGLEMGPGQKGLSKKYMLREVEESLRRLETDYIDLYQSHSEDPQTRQEETLEAYAELIRAGKVRAIGASNFKPETLREALDISRKKKLPRYESLQPHYNLYVREEFETGAAQLCLENHIGVMPYFSLASGFLTGKYRSEKDTVGHSRGSRVRQYLNLRGFRILKALDDVAEQYHATPAQIALAWLMAKPAVTAPIASATSVQQLEELLAAAHLILEDEAIATLDNASAYEKQQPSRIA